MNTWVYCFTSFIDLCDDLRVKRGLFQLLIWWENRIRIVNQGQLIKVILFDLVYICKGIALNVCRRGRSRDHREVLTTFNVTKVWHHSLGEVRWNDHIIRSLERDRERESRSLSYLRTHRDFTTKLPNNHLWNGQPKTHASLVNIFRPLNDAEKAE